MFWDSLLMSKFRFSIRLFLNNLAYLCGTMFRWKHTLMETDTPLITDELQRPPYNYTMPHNLVFTARTLSYIRGVRRGTLNFWYTQSPIHYESDPQQFYGHCLFSRPLNISEVWFLTYRLCQVLCPFSCQLFLYFITIMFRIAFFAGIENLVLAKDWKPFFSQWNWDWTKVYLQLDSWIFDESYWLSREVSSLVEKELALWTTGIKLLDVTRLSEFRVDAHPVCWWRKHHKSPTFDDQDCIHWCLPGLPDIWADILSDLIMRHFRNHRR